MRKTLRFVGTVALIGFLWPPPGAQAARPQAELAEGWVLTLDGQLRPRLVTDTSLRSTEDQDSHTRVTQRARIGMTVGREDGPAFTLRLQDVRIWGEEFDTLNDSSADGFDAHEAFLLVPMPADLSLKLGRQETTFDNHRIVGNVGWTQRARSFDGGRLMLRKGSWDADLFLFILEEADGSADRDGHVPNQDDPILPVPRIATRGFGGLHAGAKVAEALRLSFAYYLVLVTNATDDQRHTLGVHADGGMNGFGYTVELYYQINKLADQDGSALLAAVQPSYTLDAPWKPSVAAWFEYLQGDGTPEGTFDTLFATNHKFYGEMDYFLNIPVHTGNQGLMDVGGRLSAKPHQRLETLLSVHSFRNVEAGDALGLELDFKVIVALMESLALRALYGVMLPDDALLGPDADAEHFAYTTLDFSF